LHAEIKSAVMLTVAHAHKTYFSSQLLRRVERNPDGHPPAKDDGWVEVWAQLDGTTLSIWDMEQVRTASQQGKQAPPTYVNVTDAFVQVLSSVTVPASEAREAKKYDNVLTLNTAGSNLLLFSCPNTTALISWAAALRLSAWEKSRLEEIYTAHLIRIHLTPREASSSPLMRGRMEGWVGIRVAGQTDWKKLWAVVSSSSDPHVPGASAGADFSPQSAAPVNVTRKKRMSEFFSSSHASPMLSGPVKPVIALYAGPKTKDRKKPLLTISDVSQAFAVYPERPDLVTMSTLIKIEGLLGDEEMAAGMRRREGWVLLMPEMDPDVNITQLKEMLRWISAIHDAFELYGRPQAWTWDPRNPTSLMFGYPVGPHRDV
ncbi:hypothetical protein FISHEDRAFT_8564, partial [Fistulina hepatica ATCC 64428]